MPVGETDERPWGTYVVLDDEESHKVKRITVKKDWRLSYQRHAQRSEHWFVVAGDALVTLDGVEQIFANKLPVVPSNVTGTTSTSGTGTTSTSGSTGTSGTVSTISRGRAVDHGGDQ